MSVYHSRMHPKGNFIQVPVSQPANPFPPFPLYLETLLLQRSNLPIEAEGFDKSDTSGSAYVTCPAIYPSSPLPSSHSILSCSIPALFETHLMILPLTLVGGTSLVGGTGSCRPCVTLCPHEASLAKILHE